MNLGRTQKSGDDRGQAELAAAVELSAGVNYGRSVRSEPLMMTGPRPSDVRYRVEPGDVPPEKAARRLHLTLDRFNELLPRLQARGFPPPDPDTGMFDLEQIDRWRKDRHGTDPALTGRPDTAQPTAPARSMGERFAAKKRSGHG
ncbi:hypothetical protein J4G43_028125 [Bradyrhizobium barranii subsp. barranii]|uniref:Uncharacterized protein n=2 Tax=Bradyrhizobium barranii subsp. barranii TaxID=2823807 RepID=A0A9X9XLT4_9BRAD|nr:hypothetical protein [Bradyrhizobium barranii]UEM08628.1 hypothetical protein J4G43_028125 [Bradyrhizobium barranii subsp. barranii]